jgi:hypothetical protein
MRIFLGALRTVPSGRVTIITVATSAAVALTAVVMVSSLISRVEKLEASIKSLRSDLDHPRVRPLASILDAETRLQR